MRNPKRIMLKSEYPSRNRSRGYHIPQILYTYLAKVSYIGELRRMSSGG
jgi:hypothetical protein